MAQTDQSKYEPNWTEDFNGIAGQLPDPKVWQFDIGDGSEQGIPGWGNLEREYYTADAAILDGTSNLSISAARLPQPNEYACYYGDSAEWSSAKLLTRNRVHFKFGRIEVGFKIPSGKGTWPAIWMLGTDIAENPWPSCGEIDIMEARGDMPNTVFATVHGPGYCGDSGVGRTVETATPTALDFHQMAIDWLPGEISWYLDGELIQKIDRTSVPGDWVYDKEFYLLLNLAMGGNFTGEIDPELNSATLQIQYVRHYKIDGVGEARYL